MVQTALVRLKWLREALTSRRAQPSVIGANGNALTPVTLITGATQGIGAALADRFAKSGHNMLLVARSSEDLERKANALRQAHPGVAISTLPIDLTDTAALCARLDTTLQQNNAYLDVLVNNAGLGVSGPFHETDPDEIERLIDVNISAATVLMRHVLPGMVERKSGGVLNISSLAGYVPGPHQSAYYASKGYLNMLSRAVANEVNHHGVRITCCTPGPVRTEFHAKVGADAAFYTHVLPLLTPDAVAHSAHKAFMYGSRLSAPGLLGKLTVVTLRVLPYALSVPIMAYLLKQRS